MLRPFQEYRDTVANIAALATPHIGAVAYATDTSRLGTYDGTVWNYALYGTIPDNDGAAMTIVDDGAAAPAAVEYMRIVTTNAGPAQAVVFNNGEVDVDHRVAALGVTNALFVQGSDGFVGVGVVPSYGLQAVTTNGFFVLSDTAVDETNKTTRWMGLHYDTDEEPVTALNMFNSIAGNVLNWGGGTALGNAATNHSWYAAANNTTTTGTEAMRLTLTGLYVGAGVAPTEILTIAAATPIFLIENDQITITDNEVLGEIRFKTTDTTLAANRQIVAKILVRAAQNYNGANANSGDMEFYVSTGGEDIAASTTPDAVLTEAGQWGVGVSSGVSAKLHVLDTGTQLRLTHTAGVDYLDVAVDANGQATFTTVDGGGAAGHINLNPDGNLGLKTSAFGANLLGGFAIANGTAATGVLANGVMAWSADFAPGDARWYFMGELNTKLAFIGGGIVSVEEGFVVNKTTGKGIKVDTATPTFGWRDLLGDTFTQNTGASKPTHVTYRDTLKQFQFAAGDEEYFEFHIPHDYVEGTDIFLHFHWSHIGTLVTGGTVTFEYECTYAKGHNQAAFPASVSGTVVGAASNTQYQHIISEGQLSAGTPGGDQIDTDDLEPDGVIILRAGVQANNITVSGGGVPDPFIHYVDIHYQSTNVGTKDKVPDFYA